ncbi:hypothetical protein [Falsiroseomonas sp.]|uniref:hypothetical protein n=1 Tax=Falsiroseomonas sp. TaxID=2870721 RepID=UPI003561EAB2
MHQLRKPSNRPSSDAVDVAAAAAAEAVHQAFMHRFVEAQYAWTAMLLDHLAQCRRRLGDLDAVVVLGVLGLSALAAARRELERVPPGAVPDFYSDKVPPGSAINAHSLAEITGIPRETVRRKLAFLARAGLIQRMPNRAWSLAATETGGARARGDLQDLTDSAAGNLARLFARLVTLAEAAATEAKATRRAASGE